MWNISSNALPFTCSTPIIYKGNIPSQVLSTMGNMEGLNVPFFLTRVSTQPQGVGHRMIPVLEMGLCHSRCVQLSHMQSPPASGAFFSPPEKNHLIACILIWELGCFDFRNVHLRLAVWHSIKYVCDYHALQLTLLWTLAAPLGIIQAWRLRNHFSKPWHSPGRRDAHQNVLEISSALVSGKASLCHRETCPQQ